MFVKHLPYGTPFVQRRIERKRDEGRSFHSHMLLLLGQHRDDIGVVYVDFCLKKWCLAFKICKSSFKKCKNR